MIGALAPVTPEREGEIDAHSFPILEGVARIGLLALLFLTGLECELDELMAVGRQAVSVALTGEVLPFALGVAMTATSIGITASVLGELKVLRSREGQMVIAAAVLDDSLGIVILAVVAAQAFGLEAALFARVFFVLIPAASTSRR